MESSTPIISHLWKEVTMNFGKKMRQLREQRNISTKEMAEVAGVSRVHINNTENGHALVSLTVLEKIVDRLDVTWEQMFQDVDCLLPDKDNNKNDDMIHMSQVQRMIDEAIAKAMSANR